MALNREEEYNRWKLIFIQESWQGCSLPSTLKGDEACLMTVLVTATQGSWKPNYLRFFIIDKIKQLYYLISIFNQMIFNDMSSILTQRRSDWFITYPHSKKCLVTITWEVSFFFTVLYCACAVHAGTMLIH